MNQIHYRRHDHEESSVGILAQLDLLPKAKELEEENAEMDCKEAMDAKIK